MTEDPSIFIASVQALPTARAITDVEAIGSPKLRALYAYWESLPRNPRWPRKADLDPVEIAGSLSHVILAKWDAERDDFLHLICGDTVDRVHGVRSTRRHLRDVWPRPMADGLVEAYRQPIDHEGPVHHQLSTRDDLGMDLRYERILLPMSTDGNGIDVVFGGLDRLTGSGEQSSIRVA
ncbi:MAG: PAS domain-containing protein [Alphaproteobacteria bacterium]|jgi:hypothetical protein|nr:PAS domain-containing protein [Alphaproteobacteria bacterium]